MMNRLPAITGADYCLCGQFGVPLPGIVSPATFVAFSDHWNTSQQHAIFEGFTSGIIHVDPIYRRSLEHPDRFLVHRPQDIVSDAEWRASDVFQKCMCPAGVDSVINGRFMSPLLQRFFSFTIYRAHGRQPFPRRSDDVLTFFGQELMWKLERDATLGESIEMPPRELEVLGLLRHGLSEKAVASQLDLSPHTVHDYVKSLYRRFVVNSRSELLAVVHRTLVSHGGLQLPDELPPKVDWGFNMGRAEMIPITDDSAEDVSSA